MAITNYRSGFGENYRGGSANPGSHLVGWDSGNVRAEVYSFRTGNWPITHIKWWGPRTTRYLGTDIPVNFGISTSKTAYVKSSGSSTGYSLSKNTNNELDVNLEPNTTYYFTFFPGVGRSGNWGLLDIGDRPEATENYFTIHATEIQYTQCSAPTTLALSKAVQIPGQTAILSWSGATAGTNLTIGSYDIYRSTSADGTYTLLGNTSNTSYNVEAPSAGNFYYYKVVTKPLEDDTGEYDSDLSVASSGLKGNTVPGAPTVSVNRNIVPSYGGEVTFSVIPGTDNDNQILTLAYSTTSNGPKIAFTSPLVLNFYQAATYYFYTYDGLEYGPVTSQSISVNVKPVITAATYNSLGSYNALGGDGATGSQLGYANTITPKISTTKIGNITVELESYSSDATTAWDPSLATVNYSILQQSSITSTTDVVLNSYNIHQYITLGSTNIHWRLRFKMNDGIEDSDYVYYPAESDETYYSIAHASPLLNTYNQFANSNVTGTIAGQIWREVRLKVYNDTSTTVIGAVAAIGNSGMTTTVESTVDGVYRYIDITLPDGIGSEATISIIAQMSDSNNTITKTTNATVTETKIPTLSTLNHGAPVIRPFTESGTFLVSVGWPFGSYTAIDGTTLAAYNCNTSPDNAIKIVNSATNIGSGSGRKLKMPTWTKSGDTMEGSLGRKYVYDWNGAFGITVYSGSYTYYCRLEITNLFGKVIATPWVTRTLNFSEPARNPSISSIDWSLDGTTWESLENRAIQEGVYLRFNCSFGLYSTDEVRISILLKNSSGEKGATCYEFGSPTRITPVIYASSELNRATDYNVVTNTKSYVYYISTEIADTTNRQWRLQVDTSGGTAYSGYKSTSVVRQCAPNLMLTQCETDADYQFTYTYVLTDTGGGTLTNYLYGDGENLTGALSGDTGTAQSLVVDWETKTVSVKTVSVVTGLYTNTKVYYSNGIIVYQITPTVAYRKNQLGINTQTPEQNAILDIHQSTGREVILIQGLDNSTPPKATKFSINPTTGEIKFYLDNTLKYTIDLTNGILT